VRKLNHFTSFYNFFNSKSQFCIKIQKNSILFNENYFAYHLVLEVKPLKATGIVRRIDDLGRVVIPKEIRRTMRIREGDPQLITLTQTELFIIAMLDLEKKRYIKA